MKKADGPKRPWLEKKMTLAEIEEHRKYISEQLGGIRVHAFCFEESDEHGQVIGFLRIPNLQTQSRALDSMGADKIITTGTTLLESLLIPEYSDIRILSGDPEYNQYYLGAATEAVSLIKVAQSTIKKK